MHDQMLNTPSILKLLLGQQFSFKNFDYNKNCRRHHNTYVILKTQVETVREL
jgi:hypothetical protein